MTKRTLLTREEVLDHVLNDSDQESEGEDMETFDPFAPMAKGSDDELSDLGEIEEHNTYEELSFVEGIDQQTSLAGFSDTLSQFVDGTDVNTSKSVGMAVVNFHHAYS